MDHNLAIIYYIIRFSKIKVFVLCSQVSYPMFTIEEGSSKDMEKDAKLCERIQRMESAMSSSDSNENSTESGNFVTEDFVFL